jgi:Icc-related predicted phosphoesterase
MKICCISDLHGRLPRALPNHDILLISGDICPLENHQVIFQKMWLKTVFLDWWREMDSPVGYGCWGNHDLFAESPYEPELRIFKNHEKELVIAKASPVLDNSGLSIFLTSYQLPFGNWAFNAHEPELTEIYAEIPVGTDIIVSHGPAYGYGDKAPRRGGKGYELTGSKSLLAAIDRIKPKLVVCGHIHQGYGVYDHNGTKIVNASILDASYKMANDPVIVEL